MLSLGNDNLPILAESSGPVAIIRFSQPAERNPLSTQTLNLLADIVESIEANSSVRVLILTGAEDVFLSGANIRELTNLDENAARAFSQKGQTLTRKIANLKIITIAAINGYCMGGGLDFALACDIRMASSAAVFAHPGARLGIITGWGGTQRLPRLIGRSRAIELFATARRFSAAEALRVGLVTRIADPVLEAAMILAQQLAFTS